MKKTSLDLFCKAVKEINSETANIVMHDVPDPDAMGSALGLRLILSLKGIESSIYYRGDISHPQNKTLINVLGITGFKKLTDGENLDDSVPVFIVDGTENNSCAPEIPYMVIDHHKNTSNAKHQIISPDYGSCATMIWELYKFVNTPIEEEKDEEEKQEEKVIVEDYSNVFTSLLLGVRTDTNDLTSEFMTKSDFMAYQELLDLSDKESLQKIMNYPYPKYLYDRRLDLHKDGNSTEKNGVFVGGVGFIPSSQRDVIAVLSEEYARMESVNTSIIFAIIDKTTLHVSIRSSNVSLDVGSMCRDLFGEYGGGTSYKGGAAIPLFFYSELENGEREKFWGVTCTHMFRKIFKEAWVEEHKEE